MHELTVVNGVKIEKHLCEACAAMQHVVKPSPGILVTGAAPHAAVVITTTPQGQVCMACKLTFAEFKHSGLLGCPECYKAFETQISPLVERAQEGGVRHTGKTPRRLLGGVSAAGLPVEKIRSALLSVEERAERLRRMRSELEHAVAAEEYERAARLRDEMRRLAEESPLPGAGPQGEAGGRA